MTKAISVIIAILFIIAALVAVAGLLGTVRLLPGAESDPLDEGEKWRRAFDGFETGD